MKRLLSMALCAALLLVAGGWNAALADFHIGILTGSEDQSADELRGAEAFRARYGADRVTLVNYPDSFTTEREKTVQILTELAEDPEMGAIIANQAVPGTADAFRLIKERRPEILCIAGQSHEEVGVIGVAADLVIKNDYASRGYLIIHTAHELGCDTFVHISFPRHKASELMGRRCRIMQAACEDFGMTFAEEFAPDPTLTGTEDAKAFITLAAPQWIEKYGPKAAFFCTNDAHTAPLIRQLLAYGGYFIEADLPSPLNGYPEALGLDLSGMDGDFEKIQTALEDAICAQGGAGRFGTWTYSFGYTLSAGLAQHAVNVLNGESRIDDLDDILKALQEYAPGAHWNGSHYTTPRTGEKLNHVVLLYQDTYLMGRAGHYMNATGVAIPEKYFTIE